MKHSLATLIKVTGMTASAGSYTLKLIDIIDDIIELRQPNEEIRIRLNEELDFLIISPIEAIYEAICEDKNVSKISRNDLDIIEYKAKMMEELQKMTEMTGSKE